MDILTCDTSLQVILFIPYIFIICVIAIHTCIFLSVRKHIENGPNNKEEGIYLI